MKNIFSIRVIEKDDRFFKYIFTNPLNGEDFNDIASVIRYIEDHKFIQIRHHIIGSTPIYISTSSILQIIPVAE